MFVETTIPNKWNSKNKKHFTDLGYKYTKMGDEFFFDINHIKRKDTFVKIQCDLCNTVWDGKYCNSINKELHLCERCSHKGDRNHFFGVKHSSETKNKISKKNKGNKAWNKNLKTPFDKETTDRMSMLAKKRWKDGVYTEQSKIKLRKTFENMGRWISLDAMGEWEKYKIIINRLTKRKKKELFEMWDGYDYYDGEYIKDFLNEKFTSPLYPTIDHKISKIYGFNNNIDIENIIAINNLCITKRRLNGKKGPLNEQDFKLILKGEKI